MKPLAVFIACLPVVAQVAPPPPPPAGRMARGNFTAPPEMKPGKSSIEGNVTNAVTHEPVKKATVTLFGTSTLSAVTDDAGHFAFRQLPKGTYTLNAHASQYPQQAGPPRNVQVSVGEEDAKTGVELTLLPAGTLSGRVVDEEGAPLTGCNVGILEPDASRGTRTLQMRGGANTDDRGEYHLTNITKGKYYVMARCYSNIPLPHAFIRRGPDTEVPTLSYEPQLYPGTLDPASAMKVSVAPGADTSGIDFKLTPAAGVTVRGRITAPEGDSPRRFVQAMLVPKDAAVRSMLNKPAMLNRQTGTFRIEHVMPGSYELVAFSRGNPDEPGFMARTPVEVGKGELPPIELTLERSTSVKGVLVVEGATDSNPVRVEGMRVMLQPRDTEVFMPPGQAQVQKDGTFVLPNVSNGKFNVFVSGPATFVKSITIADHDAPDEIIDYSNGVSGPLKITLSTKWANLQGSLTGSPTDQTGPLNGMIWPADGDGAIGRGNRMFYVQPGGATFTVPNLAPGKYYACVLPVSDVWSLMRNAPLVDALKNRCTSVELKEGETANAQVAFIPAGDLQRLMEEVDR